MIEVTDVDVEYAKTKIGVLRLWLRRHPDDAHFIRVYRLLTGKSLLDVLVETLALRHAAANDR